MEPIAVPATARAPAKAASIVVVIPTFNEAESIAAVVAEIPRDLVGRVIVADGGSSDGTADEARRGFVEGAALRRMVDPTEIAAACVFLASDRGAAITGEDLNVNAGLAMF